jgi:DNA-directed RNA polymerase specialized sigma24 family protein
MSDQALARIAALSEEVRRHEGELDRRRAKLREAIYSAREGGATYASIARAMGVTRQRVKQIIRSQ